MTKTLLQHLAALAAAVVFGVMFAQAIVESMMPVEKHSIMPRTIGVVIASAWLSGIVYVIIATGLVIVRRRKRRSEPMQVVTRTLLLTWATMIVISVVVCALNPWPDLLR